GRVLARRQCTALAGEVMAGRAVEPEQVAAAGHVAAEQRVVGNLAVVIPRNGRAAAVGLYVCPERIDLRLVEDGVLARGLRLAAHRGHAPGGHLEVDGGLADTDQAG